MTDPKDAAAYHPGDAPVTRPDLDALRERFAEAAYRAEKTHDFGESWTEEFADESDSYKATYYAIADALLGILPDALAAERARADQAADDLFEAEQRTLKQIARAGAAEARADQAAQRIADAPHAMWCAFHKWDTRSLPWRTGAPPRCNCWKSAAPTAEPGAAS